MPGAIPTPVPPCIVRTASLRETKAIKLLDGLFATGSRFPASKFSILQLISCYISQGLSSTTNLLFLAADTPLLFTKACHTSFPISIIATRLLECLQHT